MQQDVESEWLCMREMAMFAIKLTSPSLNIVEQHFFSIRYLTTSLWPLLAAPNTAVSLCYPHTHKHIQTKKTQIGNAISEFLPKGSQSLAAYIDSAHLLRPVWRAVIWLNQHLHHSCMSVVRRKMQSVPAILHKARYQIPSKVCILWSSLLYPANFNRLPMKVGHVVLCNRKHRANARGIHLCPS